MILLMVAILSVNGSDIAHICVLAAMLLMTAVLAVDGSCIAHVCCSSILLWDTVLAVKARTSFIFAFLAVNN